MNLFEVMADLESNEELHLGRLLILLRAFASKDGTDTVAGLTKLAKLDFLLRYPVYLERALEARSVSSDGVAVQEYERKSVESAMVRFRYGPWDFRYRRFLNLLIAQGLVKATTAGRTVHIGLTDAGIKAADRLTESSTNQDQVKRATLLKRHLNLSATNLMKFVYATFPEIGTLRLGEPIRHED